MILLAGGTGRLGVEVVELLVARGLRVRVLSRNPSQGRAPISSDIELVAGDVSVAGSLAPAVEGVETVISAITGFGPGGDGPRKVDLEGNRNLIAAAEAAGAKHFILVSVQGARPDHPMELYRAKFNAEERLRKSRLEWTIIRPTAFMELWAGIVGDSLLKTGTATIFGRGDNPINLVSVRDVAQFVELAVVDRRLRARSFEVGGPENVTLKRLVEYIAASSGRRPKARHVPLPALRMGSALMSPFRPDIAGLIKASVLMDTTDMTFSPAEINSEFPQIRLTQLAEILDSKHGAAVTT
jgi:uncharacterized protein YbjT (DUF2867 family)